MFFPYPELFVYPYLTNHGLKPYMEILDQHFPGLMFLPVNFDNLGMNNEFIARVWLVSIVAVTHLLIFWVSRYIFKSSKKALLVNILYLIWQPFFEGWALWIDSFLPLFLLPAFYLTYRLSIEKNIRYSLALLLGVVLGVGIVFKQILIPLSALVGLYLLITKKDLKLISYFTLGFLPAPLFMLYYFYLLGVLKDFWYWTTIYNLTTFAEYGRKAPFFTGVVRVSFVLIFAGLLAFIKDKKLIQVLAIYILGSLIAIYARFDFVHFQPALPFILMATVLGFSTIWKKQKTKLALAGYIIVTIWWLVIFYKGHLSNRVLFFGEDIKSVVEIIKNNTDEGDRIFIFGTVPHLYQMTKTLPAGNIFVFPFPWFLRVSEDRILEGIKKDAPEIIVADRTVEIEGQKITDFASKIDKYILENYQVFDNVGSTQIMRKISHSKKSFSH